MTGNWSGFVTTRSSNLHVRPMGWAWKGIPVSVLTCCGFAGNDPERNLPGAMRILPGGRQGPTLGHGPQRFRRGQALGQASE